jgi:hypothetical protein
MATTLNATPTPTRLGGHLPAESAIQPRVDIAQQIDGKTYSTRRAALIHTSATGESLYYDKPAGYFVVRVTRLIAGMPAYAVLPLGDEQLKQWATANGVLDRVTAKTAGLGTALLLKLARDRSKRSGATPEQELQKIVRERPEVAAIAKRLAK